MPDYIVDKVLTVLNVATITELATGDLINQVNFGNYIENTQEVLNRFPASVRENFTGKQIGVSELILFIKTEEVTYKVGSKWHLKIHKEGIMNLEEVK
ncbi:MAG TPA: hypothetical protein VK536_01640 [Candidatus Limnocylindrales bacterium]|nr:hypothetical protein [Candidatus Limnocylindrales bacterium]